ncbi:ATP-binding protein [Actinacidiphila sp. DG2A-62]|nr:ATP-binding protein [Actinacidiphila sp. DG2A-62]MEC3992669.1 ATP-binding protein [Actinacidiphila sp. DG2A-62]
MTSSATALPHSWLRGGDRASRAAAAAAAHPGRTTRVAGHRRLRGPYTAAGNLLRAVVPDVLATRPELPARHVIEILSVAPELTDRLPAPPRTLTSLASPTERTRYYSPLRTRRLAHGITEFLNAWAAASRDRGPWTLFLDDLDEADPTDQELVAILLRRARPDALRVVVGSAVAPRSEALAEALERYAAPTVLPAAARASEKPGGRDPEELLRAYVASDGTSDDPAEQSAHAAADPDTRAALHLARARELEDRDEWTLHLGAIAYHRSQAGPRSDEEGRALMTAADYCLRMGYYEATVELGRQGRAAFDPLTQERLYIVASGKTAQALGALGRTDEAEAIYHEQRARFTDPVVHMVSAYAISMLYTRAHPQERLDTAVAREYVNNAIAIASQLADPEERAFHTVFQQNGLALVELREGRPRRHCRWSPRGWPGWTANCRPAPARCTARCCCTTGRRSTPRSAGWTRRWRTTTEWWPSTPATPSTCATGRRCTCAGAMWRRRWPTTTALCRSPRRSTSCTTTARTPAGPRATPRARSPTCGTSWSWSPTTIRPGSTSSPC